MGLIKGAIIGTGFMGRVHFEAARRLGTVEPVLLSHSQFECASRPLKYEAVHICTPNAASRRWRKQRCWRESTFCAEAASYLSGDARG